MSTATASNSYKDRAVEVLRAMADLLDDVPHVMFCAKDQSGAYLAVNQAFADRAGVREPETWSVDTSRTCSTQSWPSRIHARTPSCGRHVDRCATNSS